jgi:hypothetical protein
METKEQETTGFWLTEEKMKKSGDYSPYHDCMNEMWKQIIDNGLSVFSIQTQPFHIHLPTKGGNPGYCRLLFSVSTGFGAVSLACLTCSQTM